MVKESGKENGLIKVKNYKTHSLEIKSQPSPILYQLMSSSNLMLMMATFSLTLKTGETALIISLWLLTSLNTGLQLGIRTAGIKKHKVECQQVNQKKYFVGLRKTLSTYSNHRKTVSYLFLLLSQMDVYLAMENIKNIPSRAICKIVFSSCLSFQMDKIKLRSLMKLYLEVIIQLCGSKSQLVNIVYR